MDNDENTQADELIPGLYYIHQKNIFIFAI